MQASPERLADIVSIPYGKFIITFNVDPDLDKCLKAGVISYIMNYSKLISGIVREKRPPGWNSYTLNIHAISDSTKKSISNIESGNGTIEIDKFALYKFKNFVNDIQNAFPQIQNSLESSSMEDASKFQKNISSFISMIDTLTKMMDNKNKVDLADILNRGYSKDQVLATLKAVNALSEPMNDISSNVLMQKIYSTFSDIDNEVDSKVEQDNIMLTGATQVQSSANKLLSDLASVGKKTPIQYPGDPTFGDSDDELKSLSEKYFDATTEKSSILEDFAELKKQVNDKSSPDWGSITKSDAMQSALDRIEGLLNPKTESMANGFFIKVSDLKSIEESVTDISSTSSSIIKSTTIQIQKDLTQGTQENAMYGSLMDKVFNMMRTIGQSGVALS